MKLFLWKNDRSESGVEQYLNNFYHKDSSNAHSGGCVVLAENEEEAFQLLKEYNDDFDMRNETDRWDENNNPRPIEIPLDKKIMVLFCDGDCD